MTSIFEYDNYRGFLKDALDEKVRKNSGYSLRAFARLLGISPSHLSRALAGQKRLSAASARLISLALKQTPEEAEHFLGLIELESAAQVGDRARILGRMKGLAKGSSKILQLETFRVVSDWYHFAILSLTNTKGFQSDANWIARRLGIKPLEAKLAVERLIAVGLLERVKSKTLRAVNDADVATTDDVSSAAIQENHKQQLRLAADALEDFSVELREFQNLSLTMNLQDMPQAKKMIRTFIDKFSHGVESKPGQEVFQLNIQLYPLTRIEKGRA